MANKDLHRSYDNQKQPYHFIYKQDYDQHRTKRRLFKLAVSLNKLQ